MNIDKYIADDQDPKVTEKIITKLTDLLMSDEEIIYLAVQKKPAVNILPDAVAVCSRRIFYCSPSNLGLTMNFKDISWKNIKEVSFKEGLLGSKFLCIPVTGEIIVTDYIPKVQVRKLYQAANEQLESFRNTNRNQEIEVKNLLSSDDFEHSFDEEQIGTYVQEENVNLSLSEDDIEQKLLRLKSLYDKQLITRDEYERKKAAILDSL